MVDSAMTSSIAPNFVVRNPSQAKACLGVIAVCGMALLAACGGNHGSAPPTALSYDTPQALYVTGETIAPNQARITGGKPTSFEVSPALPDGLSLDTRTGSITGQPTTRQRQTSHIVTARHVLGSVQTELRLTVTARGAWASVGTVPTPRHYSTLSRLLDGRLLLAGGIGGAGPSGEADLYDPASGTWSAAAPMLHLRSDPGAVRLPDGRVLVFGGDGVGLNTTVAAELYDPVANTWTATGSMNEPRTRATAHLLPNGKVLVAGGYDRTGALSFSNTAEVYDPATGTWSLLATPLSAARAQHAAELLPDGTTLLVMGGVNASGFVTTAERYAVDGTATTPIAFAGSGNVHQSVRLDDGSVLVVSDAGTTARRFDPSTSTWTTSTLSSTRSLPTMTLLADGRVLLAGGSSLNSAEIYNPDVNVWTTASPMANVRRAAVAQLLGDGRVLVVSGFDGAGEVNSTERYTP